VPLVPGIEQHLTYTSFFYDFPGSTLLFAILFIAWVLIIINIPMAVRAATQRPAAIVDARGLTVYGVKRTIVPAELLRASAVRNDDHGNLVLSLKDGSHRKIVLADLSDPQRFARSLSEFTDNSARAT
jgi:hypothetical protein